MSAEQPTGRVPGSTYFDRWYADMDVSPVKDAIMARHLGVPETYAGSTGALPWEGLDEIARELRLEPGDALADIACGRGGYGIELARRCGASLVGVDFSAVALKRAQITAHRHLKEHRARFVVGALTATTLPANSVNALLCIDSVQFAEPPAAALEEFRRVLVRGGRLALTTWQTTRPDPRTPPRITVLNLRRDLERLGFKTITLARRPHWRAIERALYEEVVATPNDGSDPALASIQEEARRSLEQFDSLQRIVVHATAP